MAHQVAEVRPLCDFDLSALTLFFKTCFLNLKRGFQQLLSFLLVGVVDREPVLPRPDCKVGALSKPSVACDGEAGQHWAGDQIIHDVFEVVCGRMTQLHVHVSDLGKVASELFKRLQSNF